MASRFLYARVKAKLSLTPRLIAVQGGGSKSGNCFNRFLCLRRFSDDLMRFIEKPRVARMRRDLKTKNC
jgi:hypothetical protein